MYQRDYTINYLVLSRKRLHKLPKDIYKYTNLHILVCNSNELTSLDNLPITLTELYCANNKLTSLDNLPPNLQVLFCNYNKLTNLDNLPITLINLNCCDNQIISLDNLPPNLQVLHRPKRKMRIISYSFLDDVIAPLQA